MVSLSSDNFKAISNDFLFNNGLNVSSEDFTYYNLGLLLDNRLTLLLEEYLDYDLLSYLLLYIIFFIYWLLLFNFYLVDYYLFLLVDNFLSISLLKERNSYSNYYIF